MQTSIDPTLKNSADIAEADSILRACVHCGFCTATCPTYQLLGTELDSPRGRIYLIKELLEGKAVTEKTRTHLDRCLTCRSCETTCPSGVQYGRLIEIGRDLIEEKIPRTMADTMVRDAMLKVLPDQRRVGIVLKAGRALKPLLPKQLRNKIPGKQKTTAWPKTKHTRQVLALGGCVQPAVTPNTNAATARVLDALGISLINIEKSGCCGAINQHMSDHETAKALARNNIDAWWPHIKNGAEAIAITASACSLMIKEYGRLLNDDPQYADKAIKVSELARDISEIIRDQDLSPFTTIGQHIKVAYHSSCTSQHGQKLSGVVEKILQRCGYILTPIADGHICCGAAGTYTLLQSEISQQLLHNKLNNLEQHKPDVIATTNIGCQLHLDSATNTPVKHWIELLDSQSNNH